LGKKILILFFLVILVIGFVTVFSLISSQESIMENLESTNLVSTNTQNKTQLRYPSNYIFFNETIKNYKSENQLAKSVFSRCGIDSHCAADSMIILSKNQTKHATIAALKEIVSTYDETGMACHNQSHHLGEFLYGYIGNLTEALIIADRKCGGGLYHGVIENYFQTELFFERSNKDTIPVKESCDILGTDPYSHLRLECTHGTGHGLSRAYDFDVFSAVTRCDEFRYSMDHRACYRGVFMENLVEHWEGRDGEFKEDDVFYPCNHVDEKYANDCYHYQAQYILDKNGYFVEDSFEDCKEINNENYEKYCYYGIGIQISFAFVNDKPGIISTCQKGDPVFVTFCLQGAVLTTVDQKGIDEAIAFCKILEVDFKEDCYDTIGKWVNTMGTDMQKRKGMCSKAEALEFVAICNQADPEKLELLS
jgi:hypothetical protein